MKKFWTLLALLAVALNFSSASLWAAEEKKEDSVVAVAASEVTKEGSDAEVKLEEAAVATDESVAAVEEKTDAVVAKPTDSTVKTEVSAVVEEEKKTEELEAILPETVKSEEKVS